MSTYKSSDFEVKEFSFGQLVPDENANPNEVLETFELKSLKDAQGFKNNLTDEMIREEREFEAGSSFEIMQTVKDHRGLSNQANDDYEKAVAEEVERRIQALQEEAYNAGFQQGQQDGQAKAYEETQAVLEEKITEFTGTIENLQVQMQDVYAQSKDEAYLMVKNLSKWIVLKEVDEKYYLARLLEKLIHEINSKSNLVLHVNEKSFGYMPEIIKIVERKLGKLTNVRVEVELDMQENGIILESENNIIDGSLDAQFKSIDRLFENVGVS